MIEATPEYSIIIPAYNEAVELPQTLRAIRSARAVINAIGECIVVDNNSTDQTAIVAKAHGADAVVFEPVNQIGRARNTGAAASRGRYLIFIDADTRIQPSLLIESLALLRTGATVAGGSIVEFEGSVSKVGQLGINTWRSISQLTRTAAGSYIFCLREAFEAIGGFDIALYASEEVRLSRQLRKWGRARKLKFEIVTLAPVRTSARKLEWYSAGQLLFFVFLMMLMPFAVRSKKLCAFWYNRPAR